MLVSVGRYRVTGIRNFTKMAAKMSKYSPGDAKVLKESEMVGRSPTTSSTWSTLTKFVVV